MLWIYNIGIAFYNLLVKFAANFNPKAKLFIVGRKNIFEEIAKKINPKDKPIWFHFASLGEFEQGRPVLEAIKANQPNQKIVVTFFSPSGYEIRKNYALADVFYLPLDTAKNAEQFITLINPSKAIFTKYEFWYHYFETLNKKHIQLYLISGIFRPNQGFFKWYGGFYRSMLKNITHFFVQNNHSVSLLKSIGIDAVSLSGDTRFDRVYENAENPNKIELVQNFCGSSKVFIAGSTWLPDEKLLVTLTEKYPDFKFIIAPHEVDEVHIQQMLVLFPKARKFSDLKTSQEDPFGAISKTTDWMSLAQAQILIIDNIGLLSSLYQYANLAYIGGGFGAGIHNTLEAAAFGLPVIFGPKYDKFQEAKDLIALGAAKSITNSSELLSAFAHFNIHKDASAAAKKYVKDKKGATEMILKVISA